MRTVRVVDSHTEGEPTRLVMEGPPEPKGETIARRLEVFASLFEEHYRPLVLEPRAYEAVVGAWIGEPTEAGCLKDVIFFNPVGPLGMCGHGTMGIMATLAFLGLAPGAYRLNTPVGIVTAELVDANTVRVENVPARRIAKAIPLEVLGYGEVVGDVAWGGNTFFLAAKSPIAVRAGNMEALTQFSKAILHAAQSQGYPDVNHVELFGDPTRPDADSKNYVLCPGGEYDRSPCGTGTSAKIACLASDGKLAPGEVTVQESIIGTAYRAWYRQEGELCIPTIEGRAFVTGETNLLFVEEDPMVAGILK